MTDQLSEPDHKPKEAGTVRLRKRKARRKKALPIIMGKGTWVMGGRPPDETSKVSRMIWDAPDLVRMDKIEPRARNSGFGTLPSRRQKELGQESQLTKGDGPTSGQEEEEEEGVKALSTSMRLSVRLSRGLSLSRGKRTGSALRL